jgi:hypothetical protein
MLRGINLEEVGMACLNKNFSQFFGKDLGRLPETSVKIVQSRYQPKQVAKVDLNVTAAQTYAHGIHAIRTLDY